MADTRERLLDVAERLFAEKGIEPTSLRTITREAGVNLAAVHYHFGSRRALIHEVFARRLRPVNEERLRRLTEAEAEDPPRLEPVLAALVLPALVIVREPGRRHFRRLMGRAHSGVSDEVREIFVAQFERIARRFVAALARAVPELTPEQVGWRFKFAIGAMAFVMVGAAHPRVPGVPSRRPEADEASAAELVAFLAAGFRAGVPA